MLSVADALEIVLRHTQPRKPEITALTSSALGMILADEVRADIDSPPFAKAMMDGYALRSVDCTTLPVELQVVAGISAGAQELKPIGAGEAARIMTGAPIPPGADAVVMLESTESFGESVRILGKQPRSGLNILPQGSEFAVGSVVLEAGTRIGPQEFGILATVGRTTIPTFPAPRVGIIATGDELVEANMKPKPGQLRNSNGPMLVAQAARIGALPRYLGLARDDKQHAASLIREGLETADAVVLAGGVSMGDRDLIPEVLQDLGVVAHFHKVAMKPGKPLLFGTRGSTLVFGLPGNPVSSFVGFELFVRPALRRLAGEAEPRPLIARLPITAGFHSRSDRPTYYPARVVVDSSGAFTVTKQAWSGSADLRGVSGANAFIRIDAGEHTIAADSLVPVVIPAGF